MALLFVYGTLMVGFANHHVLTRLGGRRLDRARTSAPRTLVDLGPYPALLPPDATRDREATCVEGELHELPDGALEEVDRFEGAPELYRRATVRVTTPDGVVHDAFGYELVRHVPARARVLADGRYTRRGTTLPRGVDAGQIDGED